MTNLGAISLQHPSRRSHPPSPDHVKAVPQMFLVQGHKPSMVGLMGCFFKFIISDINVISLLLGLMSTNGLLLSLPP